VVTPAKTTIVLIQNGYGVELPHRRMFPTNPIVSAVTIISAALVAPNVVVQNRWTRISFGAYSDGGASSASSISSDSISSDSISSDSISSTKEKEMRELQKTGGERVDWLVETMKELGGIKDAEAYDEVGLQTVRWHKLAINAAFNPSSILSGGLGNSEMVRDPELRAHLKGCMDEIFHAAEKVLGRELPGKLARPEAILRSTERNVGGKPSMLLDWEAGRPLELEVILGNPVRMARERGVEMKKLSSLYALLRSMQEVRNGRKEEEKNSGGAKL
jgi:2-dehydropantoate 2-reductase